MMAAPTYNYRRFTPEEYEFAEFTGLSAGDRFIDADLHTLDGGTARISDFLDKPLVLETGSMTCPMYAQSAAPMQDMVARFPDLNFVVLYVREAHPGERTQQHASQTAKVDTAIRSRSRHHEGRVTLVDDLDGAAHKAYGAMPNSIFVIDTDGTVLYRSIWNNTDKIGDILTHISARMPVAPEELKAKPPLNFKAITVLLSGGLIATFDFVWGLRKLIAKHVKVGNM
jgi:peroxiredoxin